MPKANATSSMPSQLKDPAGTPPPQDKSPPQGQNAGLPADQSKSADKSTQ